MRTLTHEMADECRHALDTDGFHVIRGVVEPDRLAEFEVDLATEYQRAVEADEMFAGGGHFSGHLNCYPGEPARFAYDEIRTSGIVEIVASLNADWAARPRVTLNYNLPGSHAQHYHMDGTYTADFLICNVAVVDTDLINGALDVLPGTHQRFYRFWEYALERKFRTSTRVNLAAGDVVIRRSTLWHRGMPNLDSVARPMLAVTFGESSEPVDDPLAAHDGRLHFYPNWYSPSRLGHWREKVTVRVPATFSTYRFVRSLFSDKGYDH